jgi:tRNA threonylcarbamoyladenosine biosynthesis protein TsaB
MARLLAIETATESCSVALSLDGKLFGQSEIAPRGHAELLLPWVGQLLNEGGVALADLDAIAFSCGPGSFTSLRIGIGVTQGLAWGAGIPVIPVSSLQSAAQAAAALGVRSAIVALDARMNEVYTGNFKLDEQGLMRAISDEAVCPPEQITMPETADWAGIGNGFERYEALEVFGKNLTAVHSDIWPSAAAMIQLADDWLKSNQPSPPEKAQAVYIRDQVAKKSSKQ